MWYNTIVIMDNQTQNESAPQEPEGQTQPSQTEQSVTPVEEQLPVGNQTEHIFATIGYMGPLFIIPLVAQPKSEYCKFHARQSMALLTLFFVQLVILVMIPLLGSLITLAVFAAYILSMYNAYMGRLWKVPVIGALAQKIDFDKFLTKAATATISNMSAVKEKAGELSNVVGNAVSSVTNDANAEISKKTEEKK